MSRRPSVFQSGTIGEPIGQFIGAHSNALNQRREESAMESDDRKKLLNAQDEAAKLKYLDGFKVDSTGVNTVDTYNLAELEKMKTQLSDAFKNGATISQVAPYASGRMSNITRGYTIAKNHEANIDKKLQELAKEYPSADLGAAKSHMNNEMLKDIFDYDENGQVKSYKDPSTIPLEKAYGANLENEDNLHLWNKPSGELIKHVEGLPRAAYQENEYVDKKGFKHGYNASGELSGLQEHVRGANNDITGIKYKTEKVKWGSNEIEVMPKEQFDVAISNASKKAKADFYVATNPEIEKASYMKMQAVGQPLTTEEKDVIRRKMALEMFSGGGYDKSTFKKAEKEGVPKPPVTNIHNHMGGNQAPVREMYTPVYNKVSNPETPSITINGKAIGTPLSELDSDEAEAMVNEARKATGNNDLTSDKLFLKAENGKLKIYSIEDRPLPTTTAEAKGWQMPNPIVTISPQGVDIKAQPTAKGKNTVIARGEKEPTKTGTIRFVGPDGKTYEGTQDTIDKMTKAGVKFTIKK
jgi:hypothetical protein